MNVLLEEPAWTDEHHPDLMSVEDVDHYVRTLRESWMPHAWEESQTEAETDG